MSPRRLTAVLLIVVAAAFGWLFYERYWKWRDCIREALSSCVTPHGDNLTSGGMVWGIFGAVLAAAALYLVLRR